MTMPLGGWFNLRDGRVVVAVSCGCVQSSGDDDSLS